jgi:hypothetical protein
MSVTLEEILAAVGGRVAVISAETAGYLVLAAAEQPGGGSVGRRGITLCDDGSVRIAGALAAAVATPEVAERALRLHLGDLLAGAPGGRVALNRVAVGVTRGLDRLPAELEAALIPLNRAAAKRALARLCRDVTRVREAGKLPPLPEVVEEPRDFEVRPVFVAATEESPAHTPWSVVAPVPSPLPIASIRVDGNRTPFLGGWSFVSEAKPAPSAEPFDTEPQPAVPRHVVDVPAREETRPLFRRDAV